MRVLIAGGGPAGSLAAIHLADKAEVTVVEEHPSAGFPVQCAGLISDSCFDELKRFASERCMLNRINGAFFFAPDGSFVELKGRSKAVVVERKILDGELLRRAAENASIKVKTKFLSCDGKKALLKGVDGEEFFDYDVIVGADGISSAVARTMNFLRPRILLALQVECRFEAIDEQMVELYFGKGYSDCFFGYSVPLEDTARVGVISSSNPGEYLKNLLKRHPSVSKRVKGSIIELNAGAIPIELVDFVKGNTALIGDAAGMVKPYTGGGLYYLLVAAKILGETFPDLKEYKKEYIEKMRKEYRTGEKIASLYSTLNDSDYINLVKIGKGIESFASELHMDSPSTLLRIIPKLKGLIVHPRLSTKIFRTFIGI